MTRHSLLRRQVEQFNKSRLNYDVTAPWCAAPDGVAVPLCIARYIVSPCTQPRTQKLVGDHVCKTPIQLAAPAFSLLVEREEFVERLRPTALPDDIAASWLLSIPRGLAVGSDRLGCMIAEERTANGRSGRRDQMWNNWFWKARAFWRARARRPLFGISQAHRLRVRERTVRLAAAIPRRQRARSRVPPVALLLSLAVIVRAAGEIDRQGWTDATMDAVYTESAKRRASSFHAGRSNVLRILFSSLAAKRQLTANRLSQRCSR